MVLAWHRLPEKVGDALGYIYTAKHLLGFLRDDYEVEFEGNSLASQLCSNYQPSLCAHGRLPLLQYVNVDERESFLTAFVEMAQNDRNIVAANNAYLAEEVAWQVSIRARIWNNPEYSQSQAKRAVVAKADRLPYSPYFDGFGPLDVERGALETAGLKSATTLLNQRLTPLPNAVHLECLVKSVAAWRFVRDTDRSACEANFAFQGRGGKADMWQMAINREAKKRSKGSRAKQGTFFFRFGWRGRGVQEEHWYREAIMRLLGLVLAYFDEAMWLSSAIQKIIICQAYEDLPEWLGHEDPGKITQAKESPEAQLVISPVPYHLTMQVLRQRMECFGKIAYIRRRSHAIGVGADALIQFAQPAHAACALEAVNDMKVLGPTVIARPAGRISPSNMAFVSSQAKAGKELSEAVQIPTERSVDRLSDWYRPNDGAARSCRAVGGIGQADTAFWRGKSVHRPADKKVDPSDKDKDKESKRKAAAAKSKRDHEEFCRPCRLGSCFLLTRQQLHVSECRTRGSDGSMQGAGVNVKKDDGKKRKDAPGADSSVPKMKVRHDSEAFKEGESVVMTLSDQRLIDKDGNLVETQDELSNTNLLDSDKAKKNEAIRSQVEYDPTKPNADILDKYDEPGAAPTGFMIGGVPTGVIDERDPEKRLAILTQMSENQTLDFGNKFQSDFYTSDEMAKFKKPTKKPKRKARSKAPALS
ncbi:U4/U6.U5 tri-snRNP-associated protein 1 (SNU66 homolog) (hSnu66) (Squamous cell carcinoma antigen recognized by T-cells 1) (SART-1) (hSART-1) (U4/U6.U5 tri-snRNP-associated 110 kDa protein) (allergen Hom s 1) [Durusdinium trenchii]|uniref:RRM domain-containing protein n=1 Tax=Durusdinium trenchii TaxID=1381693 RepID=A0ABP0JKH1_9DINO